MKPTASQFQTLLAVQSAIGHPLERRRFTLRHLSFSCVLKIDLGSACPKPTNSPTGSGPAFFKAGPPPITYIGAAAVMLKEGQLGPSPTYTLSFAPAGARVG